MKRYYLELEKIDRRTVTLVAACEDNARTIAEEGGGDLERDDEEGLWICRHWGFR